MNLGLRSKHYRRKELGVRRKEEEKKERSERSVLKKRKGFLSFFYCVAQVHWSEFQSLFTLLIVSLTWFTCCWISCPVFITVFAVSIALFAVSSAQERATLTVSILFFISFPCSTALS